MTMERGLLCQWCDQYDHESDRPSMGGFGHLCKPCRRLTRRCDSGSPWHTCSEHLAPEADDHFEPPSLIN